MARTCRSLSSAFLGMAALVACAAAPDANQTTEPAAADPILLQSTSGAYLAGQYAVTARDVVSASHFFDTVLETDPDNVGLRQRAFRLRLEAGRFDDALTLAPPLVQTLDSDAPIARLALIVDAAVREDFDTGLALLEDMPSTRLNEILVPLLSAWVSLGAGETDGTADRLAPLADRQSFKGFHDVHAALLAAARGDTDDARGRFAEILAGREVISQRLLLMAAALDARAERLEDALALVDERAPNGLDRPAAKAWLTALASSNDSVGPAQAARRGMAEALFDLASALQRERGSDTAMLFVRLALALDPSFGLATLLAAEILDDQEQDQVALDLARSVGRDSPYWVMAQLRIAGSLEALDRRDEAISGLEALAASRSDLASPLIRIGDLERGREAWGASIVAYDRAIERLGPAADNRWSLHYTRGIAFERSGRWPEAETAFKTALSINPDQPYVLNYLGYSWVDRGENLQEALEMIEKAVDLRPNDGYIVDSLGWALYRLEDFNGAVVHLERAVELRPTDPTINDHLGDAYWMVGRRAEARFQWQRALTFEPEPELEQSIRSKLESGLLGSETANGLTPSKG